MLQARTEEKLERLASVGSRPYSPPRSRTANPNSCQASVRVWPAKKCYAKHPVEVSHAITRAFRRTIPVYGYVYKFVPEN